MSSMIKRASNDAFFKPPRVFPKRSPGGFPIGPRARKRAEMNRQLSKTLPPEVKSRCEVRIPGICAHRTGLTWAHSKKSRFLVTDKDWLEAARCCLPCHDHIEALKHETMKAIIIAAINRRTSYK